MAHASGANAQVNLYEEPTYGAVGTNATKLHAISANFGLNQDLVSSRVLTGDRNPTQPITDQKTVSGTLVVQMDAQSLGWLFKHAIADPVTAGAGPYTHTYKIGALETSMTLEKVFNDVSEAYQSLGCRINSMSIDLNPQGIAEVTFDILGQDETSTAVVDAAPTTYSAIPMKLASIAVEEGGGASTIITQASINFSNELEETRVLGNAGLLSELPEGFGLATGSIRALFEDGTLLDKGANETESSLKFTFSDGGSDTVELLFPEILYSVTSPPIEGPGGVIIDLSWSAYLDDGSEGSAFQAIISNSVVNYTAIAAS